MHHLTRFRLDIKWQSLKTIKELGQEYIDEAGAREIQTAGEEKEESPRKFSGKIQQGHVLSCSRSSICLGSSFTGMLVNICLLLFLSNCSLTYLKSNRWWFQIFLSPCQSHGTPGYNSCALSSAWPNPSYCDLIGKELEDERHPPHLSWSRFTDCEQKDMPCGLGVHWTTPPRFV